MMIRDLSLGFIKLHILHHAGQEPVYGLWLIEELARHGYKLSPGTLYPMLHSLEQERLLASEKQLCNGKVRKYYRLTKTGSTALRQAQSKIVELLNELNEDSTRS